jgi:hypothetical protein
MVIDSITVWTYHMWKKIQASVLVKQCFTEVNCKQSSCFEKLKLSPSLFTFRNIKTEFNFFLLVDYDRMTLSESAVYSPRVVHIIDEFLWMCCISQHVVNAGHWAFQTTSRNCLEVTTLATHICPYCLFYILHNCCNVTYRNMYLQI